MKKDKQPSLWKYMKKRSQVDLSFFLSASQCSLDFTSFFFFLLQITYINIRQFEDQSTKAAVEELL